VGWEAVVGTVLLLSYVSFSFSELAPALSSSFGAVPFTLVSLGSEFESLRPLCVFLPAFISLLSLSPTHRLRTCARPVASLSALSPLLLSVFLLLSLRLVPAAPFSFEAYLLGLATLCRCGD